MNEFIEVLNKLAYIANSILNWTVQNINNGPVGIVIGIVILVLVFVLLRQWATNLSVVLGRFFTTKYDTQGRPIKVKSLGTGYLLANSRLSSFKLNRNKARKLFVSRRI